MLREQFITGNQSTQKDLLQNSLKDYYAQNISGQARNLNNQYDQASTTTT
jgi:hypothetical protein